MAGGEGERRRREARSRLRGAGGRGGGRGGRARAVGLHGTAAHPTNGLILGTFGSLHSTGRASWGGKGRDLHPQGPVQKKKKGLASCPSIFALD